MVFILNLLSHSYDCCVWRFKPRTKSKQFFPDSCSSLCFLVIMASERQDKHDEGSQVSTAARSLIHENWRICKLECDRMFDSLEGSEQKEFVKAIAEARKTYARRLTRRRKSPLTLQEAFDKSSSTVKMPRRS